MKTELVLGVYHCINYSCCYSGKKYGTKFQNENLFFLQFEGTKFKQNHEVVGYVVSTVESRVTCWLFIFLFVPLEWCCGPSGWVFLPQLNLSRDTLTDMPRSLSLRWLQIQSQWQRRLITREGRTLLLSFFRRPRPLWRTTPLCLLLYI